MTQGFRALCVVFLLAGAGCASPAGSSRGGAKPATYRWAETDLDSKAPGAAFAGSAMFPRLLMPDRREFRDWEFFYKHCSRVEPERPYVSKTQYDCNGPY